MERPAVRPASETVPVLAVPVRLSDALKPCALATGVGMLLMFMGLTPSVAMFSVGFLAVMFYRQGHPGVAIRAANGARLGAFGGLMFFAVVAALVAVAAIVPELRLKLHDQMIENRAQILQNAEKWAASRPSDPQVQAALEQMKSSEGFIMMAITLGVLFLVLAILLGILGGALGGGIFGRRGQG